MNYKERKILILEDMVEQLGDLEPGELFVFNAHPADFDLIEKLGRKYGFVTHPRSPHMAGQIEILLCDQDKLEIALRDCYKRKTHIEEHVESQNRLVEWLYYPKYGTGVFKFDKYEIDFTSKERSEVVEYLYKNRSDVWHTAGEIAGALGFERKKVNRLVREINKRICDNTENEILELIQTKPERTRGEQNKFRWGI